MILMTQSLMVLTNVQDMFEPHEPTIDSIVLPQSLDERSYTHTQTAPEKKQGSQRNTVNTLDAYIIDEPTN